MDATPTPVLVFDGDCGFCTSAATWATTGWEGRATAVPWQTLGAGGLGALGLTVADARGAAWWIDGSGAGHRGNRAVGEALRAGRGARRVAGAVILTPPFSWLASAVYAVVVRYRHRLPGGTPACRVP